MAELSLVSLFKTYDKVSAVHGVSIDIPSGEFVVILGPSGCGKTTTLRCVAGLEIPDSGSILIDGSDVTSLPPRERDVAMVFQNYALYPHMTVSENISYPLRMKKIPKTEIGKRVREVAQLLGIEHLLARRPRQLSGGEQQRVALGRAIVRRPKIFLMDEPLSNLDAKLRLNTRAELKRLQRQLGVTTVYVTHDQAEALALADKIAIMNNGRLLQYDTPTEVYSKPKNAFVAGFIGAPPMNILKASVQRRDGRLVVSTSQFSYNLPSEMSSRISGSIPEGEIFLGVRPEDILLSAQRSGSSVFEADVYVVEPMGPTVMVDIRTGDHTLKSIISATVGIAAGSRVWVGFQPEKIHIFDSKTEMALS